MLPMLTVTGVPGLLYLNGRLCGETGASAMPLSPDGVQYLELRPFDLEERGAVLRLRVEDGRLVEGVTGDVFAVQWPSGWIAMELKSAMGAQDAMATSPRLLSQLAMPGGQYLLVDEGGHASFGRDSVEAIFLPVEDIVDGTLRALPYAGLCLAEGSTTRGQFAAVLRAEDAPALLVVAQGSSVQVDGQGVMTSVEPLEDVVGHAILRTLAPDATGAFRETSRDIAWRDGMPRWPMSPQDTAKAWLEALLLGASEEAMGYLLQPSQQQQFMQVVGTFASVTQLPEDGDEGIRLGILQMEGENLATVREIRFTTVRMQGSQGEYKIESVWEGV